MKEDAQEQIARYFEQEGEGRFEVSGNWLAKTVRGIKITRPSPASAGVPEGYVCCICGNMAAPNDIGACAKCGFDNVEAVSSDVADLIRKLVALVRPHVGGVPDDVRERQFMHLFHQLETAVNGWNEKRSVKGYDSIDAAIDAAPTSAGVPDALRVMAMLLFQGHLVEKRGEYALTGLSIDAFVRDLLTAPSPAAAGTDAEDARRYRRLSVIGCAPDGSKNLQDGTVLRFTNLDAFVDADLKAVPSRGEGQPAPTSAGASDEELARLREIEHRVWHLLDGAMNEGEGDDEKLTIDVYLSREDLDVLKGLLPEDHPPIDEAGRAILAARPTSEAGTASAPTEDN